MFRDDTEGLPSQQDRPCEMDTAASDELLKRKRNSALAYRPVGKAPIVMRKHGKDSIRDFRRQACIGFLTRFFSSSSAVVMKASRGENPIFELGSC